MEPHSNRNTPCGLHAKKLFVTAPVLEDSMRMEVRRWSKLMSLNGNACPCQPMSTSKVTLCSTDHQQHYNSCPVWLLSKQLCQRRKFGHEVIREHTRAIYFELGSLSAYIWRTQIQTRIFIWAAIGSKAVEAKYRQKLFGFLQKNRRPRQKVSKSSEGFQILE